MVRKYTLWQRDVLSGEYLSELTSYWTEALTGAPSVIDLPIDYERPMEQSFRGASCEQNLGADVLAGVKRLASQHDATLFMVLNAAMAVVLGCYSASGHTNRFERRSFLLRAGRTKQKEFVGSICAPTDAL